jgi:hypothetical protein
MLYRENPSQPRPRNRRAHRQHDSAAVRACKAAGGPGWIAGGDHNRIVTIQRDGQVEEWLTIHPTGRLEHHYKNGNCSRDQWIDLDFVKNYWPHLTKQVEDALTELGAL